MTDPTIATAALVTRVLDARGVASALIGGLALAAHGYTRATLDLDLATSCSLDLLRAVANDLVKEGLVVDLREPGPIGEDPLDGVLRIGSPGGTRVDVVNMKSSLGRETVATAIVLASLPFRVADLAHLVALKLRAGGPLDRRDVQELMLRNADADRSAVRVVCARFRVSKRFDRLMAEMTAPPDPEDPDDR